MSGWSASINRPDLPREGLWLWLGNIQLHIILGPHAEVEKRTDGLVCHMSFEAHSMEKVQKELTVLMAKDPSTCKAIISNVNNRWCQATCEFSCPVSHCECDK